MAHPLSPQLLIDAYSQGLFPMADGPNGDIQFYSSNPRALIPLDSRFHVRRSLRKALNKSDFTLSTDTAFEAVIHHCATVPRGEDGIWLTEPIMDGFVQLHQMGLAHSVECRHSGQLVGGIYGLALGGAFFGESMFSLQPHASQAALVALVDELRRQQFTLFDAQIANPHTRQFGLQEVTPAHYQHLLNQALRQETAWGTLEKSD